MRQHDEQQCFRLLKCVLVYRTHFHRVKASQLMQGCQEDADVAQEIVIVVD